MPSKMRRFAPVLSGNILVPATPVSFLIGSDFLLPIHCGNHSDYQNFVIKNLRKYYPDPDSISRDVRVIIDRFWNLDLSYTYQMLKNHKESFRFYKCRKFTRYSRKEASSALEI